MIGGMEEEGQRREGVEGGVDTWMDAWVDEWIDWMVG